MKKIERKLNRLLKEYDEKIASKRTEIRVLLIDFAREYNEIWNSADNINKTNKAVIGVVEDRG